MGAQSGLCECGCGTPTTVSTKNCSTRGYVKGVPKRYVLGHGNRPGLHEGGRYSVDPDTGCWNWLLRVDRDGYGEVKVGRRHFRAPRLYYEDRMGSIPDGLVIDHLCRNPCCVNPDHLEPVTVAENTRRGNSTALSPADVRDIRRRGALNEPRTSIALLYGVHPTHITSVIARRRWREAA